MTIQLSSRAIIAGIQAISAMRAYMNGGMTPPLTRDRNEALTVMAVDSFHFALMKIVSYVESYSVSPADYVSNASADVMMRVELRDVAAAKGCLGAIGKQLEHAVACMTLEAVNADTDCRLSDSYREAAVAALETVTGLLDGSDSPVARILPSR